MKLCVLAVTVLCVSTLATAQLPGKMNFALHTMAQNEKGSPVSILVKGDLKRLQDFLTVHNGKFLCSAGDIASIVIPRSAIAELASKAFVSRMEATVSHMETLNDTMRMKCHIDDVHQGWPPLVQPFDGTGVIMGLIDAGIDLSHPDFRDSMDNTRVKWLWDMTKPDSLNTPSYGYGQEWNESEINSGNSSHTGQDQFGHGSYVAGIATGNGRAVGHFQGAAPGCDIIAVAFDFMAQDTVPRLAHAVDYIFARAAQMGKPCVINISIGDYYGSHDGFDLQSQFISNLINQQCGRIVVAGCGDVGTNYAYHLGTTASSADTTFTWFQYNASYGGCYIQVFSDFPDFSGIHFSVGADKVTPYYDFRGRTPFHTAATWGGGVHTEMLMNGPNRIGIVQSLLSISSPGVYSLEYYVLPDSVDYLWRFSTYGSGKFDSWSFDWIFQNLPDSITYPAVADYVLTDTNYTIVSGLQCLDNVIAVGQYFNTDRHVDVNGILQVTPGDIPDALAPNSGRGPTRDGRVKPDICAPGNHIISCGVLAFLPGMIANQPYKVAQGGLHITGGGTSASSPVVAGIGALFLQQNPGACWQDFKTALLNCAATDNFTWGSYPNNSWGFGKAHAFNTLTSCSPVATHENHNDPSSGINLFPNPAYTTIELFVDETLVKGNCRLHCIDLTGRKLFEKIVLDPVTEISMEGLSEGTYLFHIISDNGQWVKLVAKSGLSSPR